MSLTTTVINGITVFEDVPSGTGGALLNNALTALANQYGNAQAVVVHEDGTSESFTGADTDAARGTAIVSALAVAGSGDLILLGVGTFDMSTGQIVIPDGVTLRGRGVGRTIIIGTVSYATVGAGCLIYPGDNTVTSDLTIDLSANTARSAGWGMNYASGQSQNAPFVNARLENVRIIGVTECVYIVNGAPTSTSARLRNVELISKAKCLYIGDEGLDLDMSDTYLYSDGSCTVADYVGYAAGIDIEAAGVNAGESIRCRNSRISILNGAGVSCVETVGVRTADAPVYLDSVHITTSADAGDLYDLSRNDGATGSMNVTASVVYSSSKTQGTIARSNIYGANQVEKVYALASQFDKTNSASLTVPTGMVATLDSGKTYVFEAVLFVVPDVTGGHKYSMNGSATASAVRFHIQSTDNASKINVINEELTAVGGNIGEASSIKAITRINGSITTSGAGTFGPRFAQNAATGGTTSSVMTGSYFRIREVGS